MCEFIRHTKKKTATVYKVVYKVKGIYYSIFAGTEVKVGEAIKQERKHYMGQGLNHYTSDYTYYTKEMVSKCSGFVKKEHAIYLTKDKYGLGNGRSMRILKIKLGGKIINGDGNSATDFNLGEVIPIYAGTEILEIKELK